MGSKTIFAQACPVATSGVAIKSDSSPAVYFVTDQCTKRPFKSEFTFFTYFESWSQVQKTPLETINKIPNDQLSFMPKGPLYSPAYGALVKTTFDPKVYLLVGEKRYWISSEEVFNKLGYRWNWIEDVNQAFLNKYLLANDITATDHHPDFTLIKYKDSEKVYRLEPDAFIVGKQVKVHVKTEVDFEESGYRWDRIVTVSDSEIYPDKLSLSIGEIFSLENGFVAELKEASDIRAIIEIYKLVDGKKIYHSKGSNYIPFKTEYSDYPFLSYDGIRLYLDAYNSSTNNVSLTSYNSCTDVYTRCLQDSSISKAVCLDVACRYEPVNNQFTKLSNGDFSIVYEKTIEDKAQKIFSSLPACYEKIESVFGTKPIVNKTNLYLYETQDSEIGTFGHADSDVVVFPQYSSFEKPEYAYPESACDTERTPVGHELVHIFDSNTLIDPNLREGMAVYLHQRFVNGIDIETVCEEDGFKEILVETGETIGTKAYAKNLQEFSSNIYTYGNCYFQRLEQIYGIDAVDKIIRKLGEGRGVAVENKSFYYNIVEPIVGEGGVSLAESMGLDPTCRKSIPFRGYTCDSFE